MVANEMKEQPVTKEKALLLCAEEERQGLT